MEFREFSGEGSLGDGHLPDPTYTCKECGLIFSSKSDWRIHNFEGHSTPRPSVIFKGRECGRSRLLITEKSEELDWVIVNANSVFLNNRSVSVDQATEILSEKQSGIVQLKLVGKQQVLEFDFEFQLAIADELDGIDLALLDVFSPSQLSVETVGNFINQTENYKSANSYRTGISEYLYGVILRESKSDGTRTTRPFSMEFESKYDRSVSLLASFNRPPAEAICGLVAFHYNQFDISQRKTNSARVSEVCMRISEILSAKLDFNHNQIMSSLASYDFWLSDTATEKILTWCCMPLDGSRYVLIDHILEELAKERPSDQFKLKLLASEYFYAQGNLDTALDLAKTLRSSPSAENWFQNFLERCSKPQ